MTSSNPIPQIYDTARRVVRTIVQAVPGVLALAAVYPFIVDALGIPKDTNLGAWLTASVLIVAGIAAAITRVMAIPAANGFLAKIRLAGHSGNIAAGDTYTSLVQVQRPPTGGEQEPTSY